MRQKVINMAGTGDKKEERGKRNFPLIPPYRERGKKKEQCGCVCTGDCSQYRARVREYLRTRGWTRRRLESYHLRWFRTLYETHLKKLLKIFKTQ